MRAGIVVMVLLLFATLGVIASPPAGPDVIIPDVDIYNDTVGNVAAFVRASTGASTMVNFSRAQMEALPRVDLKMKAIPARELLRYACIASGTHFDINETGMMIVSPFPVMRTKHWKVDIYGNGSTPEKLKEYFQSGGVEFPADSAIFYNRGKRVLTAVNTVENLRRIELIAINPFSKRKFPIIHLNRSVYSIGNPRLQEKLGRFTFGPMVLADMPLRELLKLLHQSSVEQDKHKIGVNFFLYPLPDNGNPKLNLSINRMSMSDLLKHICSATGLELVFDDFAVVLRQPPEPVAAPATKVDLNIKINSRR
ncbi:MAG: hypothetical protein JXR78_13170 [Victivallales bacterium]|nr:hypothetical protein [Victivallales bacterium]